jgi:glycine C-acetyltransferase
MYTLRDFNIDTLPINASDRAEQFQQWLAQSEIENPVYWLESTSAVQPEMNIIDTHSGKPHSFISFISNDYLGMSQHPETKRAGHEALETYGTGACASPMIGGYLNIHSNWNKNLPILQGKRQH